MANQQGTLTGTQGSSATQGGTGANRSAGQQGQSTGDTGVRDTTYNLISVVYHALQGAETYKMYQEDAERAQDSDLAQFFRQTCEEEKRRAQQGKALLARHLQKQSGGSGGGQQLQSGSASQQGGSSMQYGSSPRSASSISKSGRSES
jgi:hypothetical protein